jgi:FkbM family methyltransferase
MLLSIVIPAYGRADTLRRALDVFIAQAAGKYERDIEIIVVDDASPGHPLAFVSDYASKHSFIHYHRYDTNIGLERNLVACTRYATGDFLWLFGDDDYLETDDALDAIMGRLRSDEADFFIFNRTRRNKDLSQLLSSNWMELDGPDRKFSGLREFYLNFGYISVIGFISVNIFRRAPYMAINASRYVGTMYPQLGAMTEAFHSRPVVVVSKPLICQRTQTQQEKQEELKAKPAEADFMTDADRRNALYFSHPHTVMLDVLISKGAMLPEDVVRIRENTVITGLLIEFLVRCIEKSVQFAERFTPGQWRQTKAFFGRLPLSQDHVARVDAIFSKPEVVKAAPIAPASRRTLTISVVSPSFNQAEFLGDCLQSVRDQSYPAIEHLVFDPGSKDASRAIAKTFPHVTLFEEADRGQSDAINKGWSRVKGDIVAWLNSDDVFFDGDVFQKVVDRFNAPDAPDIVYGKGIYINEADEKLREIYVNKDAASLPWKLQQECGISQPALFMRRSVIERVGKLTPSNHFSMDYEYWIRCTKAGIKFAYVDQDFSIARYHTSNKTYGQRGKSYAEVCDMLLEQYGYVSRHWLRRYAEFIADGHDGVLANAGNAGARDPAKLEDEYDRLLMRYNCGVIAFALLDAHSGEQGYGDTWGELKKRGLNPAKAVAAGVPAYVRAEDAKSRKRVSVAIVTPNYNTGAFIEATMGSVLTQGYPNLQYVVVDGASTDGSQNLIESRRSSLHAYVSEPDKGHADAIVKGFALTDGEIMGWVNSDDILLPGALDAVARFFEENPNIDWITGRPSTIDETGAGFRQYPVRRFSRLRFLAGHYKWIQQESTFWRRSLWEKAGGGLDTSVRYAVDMDLWVRFFRHAELHAIDMPIGAFRQRQGQRSIAFLDAYEKEAADLIAAEASKLDPDYRYWFAEVLPAEPTAIAGEELALREPLLRIADTPILKPDTLVSSAAVSKSIAISKPRISGEDWRASLAVPDDLSAFKNRHTGKRCFVMGNGPSLNKMDLNKLNGEIVFGCNSVFLLFDRVKWRPIYYTCVDSRVLPDRRTEIDAMLNAHADMVAFLPSAIRQYTGENRHYLTRSLVPPGKNRYFFNEKRQSLDALPFSMFSTDANDGLVQPFTVTVTMLQLAHYMGFSEIYLIGCDTSYVIPKEVVKEGKTSRGELGLALTSTEDNDPNHFDPRYFGKGRQWHDPQTEKMIEHYGYARQAAELKGVSKIYNATVGGNLEVFERVEFDTLFGGAAVTQTPSKPALTQDTYIRAVTVSQVPQPLQPVAAPVEDAGLPRDAHAEVDETGVVAFMLKERRGLSHVMIDVGAHIGTSAQYFDKLGWTIHCFEPDPVNRKNLIDRFGKSSNIIIDTRAISDAPATGVSFFKSEESTGISGLHAFRDSHAESGLVDVTTIAEVVGTRNIARVDFLKIDVEGFDFSVLKGVPWAKLRPDVIECEYEDAKTRGLGHTWEDIAKYLQALGYAVYISEWHPIVRYGISHDWRRVVRYPGTDIPTESWGNIVAFREDPGIAAVQAGFTAMIRRRQVAPAAKTVSTPTAIPPVVAAPVALRPAANEGVVKPFAPTQAVAAAVTSSPTAGAIATGQGKVSEPVAQPSANRGGSLILFPIAASAGNAALAATVEVIPDPPTPVEPVPVSQIVTAQAPVASDPSPAMVTHAPVAGRAPAEKSETPPRGSRPVRMARRAVGHLRRSRVAQLGVGLMVLLVAAATFLMSQDGLGEWRPLLAAGAGVGVVGVGLLYVSYRLLHYVRLLSAENVVLQQRLVGLSQRIDGFEQDVRRDSSRQAAVVNAVAGRVERSLASGLQTLDARVNHLSDDLRKDTAQIDRLRTEQAAMAARANTLAAELAGVEARMTQQLSALATQAANNDAAARQASAKISDRLAALHEDARLQTEKGNGIAGRIAALEADGAAAAAANRTAVERAVARIGAVEESLGRFDALESKLKSAGDEERARSEAVRRELDDVRQQTMQLGARADAADGNVRSMFSDLNDSVAALREGMTQIAVLREDVRLQTMQLGARADAADGNIRSMFSGLSDSVAALRETATLEVEKLNGLSARMAAADAGMATLAASNSAALGEAMTQFAVLREAIGLETAKGASLIDQVAAINAKLIEVESGNAAKGASLIDHVAAINARLAEVESGNVAIGEALRAELQALRDQVSAVGKHSDGVDSLMRTALASTSDRIAAVKEQTELVREQRDGLAKLFADVQQRMAKAEQANAEEITRLWDGIEERMVTRITPLNDAMGRSIKAHETLAATVGGFEQKAAADRASLGELWDRVADVASLAEGATTEAAQAMAEIEAKLAQVERATAAEAQRLEALRGKVDEIATQAARVPALDEAVIGDAQALSAVAERLAVVEDQISAVTEGQVIASSSLDSLTSRVAEAVQRTESVEKTAMIDNASVYQRFNRKLQPAHMQTLEKEWTRKLSVSAQRTTFAYMAARANEVERDLDGRLATSVEDILLRTLVAQATKGPSVDVLEIGTLFGVGAAIMFDTLRNHFDKVHFTLIDPLEGYYSGGRPDILTGQPVTERTLRRNLARVGMVEKDVRLIQRLSTQPEAIAEASEKLYDVLVIDADHSYAGVKSDFENYARFVKLGGYVVFDDYGSEDWPDVKTFVDAEMPNAGFLAHVGNSWRTSVYRVVKGPDAPRSRRKTAVAGDSPPAAPSKARVRKNP